jgi:hypothetical protein
MPARRWHIKRPAHYGQVFNFYFFYGARREALLLLARKSNQNALLFIP